MAAGKFITFEGGEGSGKSTQARILTQRLARCRVPVLQTREPGGTDFAEQIRSVLLDASVKERGALAELLLFYAARADHLEQLIVPALEEGHWVVCDRFSDSTIAYQGVAGGLPFEIIERLQSLVVGRYMPSLTIILDVDPHIGMKRAVRRSYGSVNSQSRLMAPQQLAFGFAPDRFEGLDIEYHRAVRKAFLAIAHADKKRCVVVDSTGGVMHVADRVWHIVQHRFLARHPRSLPHHRRAK